MLFTDVKFLYELSPRLDLFQQKSKQLWTCRCPLCGDSQKSKRKTRGYFFPYNNVIVFKCHNCGWSGSVGSLIRQLDPYLYQQYVFERLRDNKPIEEEKITEKPQEEARRVVSDIVGLQSIKELPTDHPAVVYLRNRRIPEYFIANKIYYSENYYKWVNTILPDKFKNIPDSDPRIVLPFYDENNKLFAFAGRALGKVKERVRYITIKLNKDDDKIYGLERLNPNRPIFIVEGQFDSMFLPNCIAVAGSDLYLVADKFPDSDMTLVYDNEPRNGEILKAMGRAIDKGHKVCIWDGNIKEKDINDMILAGRTESELLDIVKSSTYQGLTAKIKFLNWKKK